MLVVLIAQLTTFASVGAGHVSGSISNITSVTSGILIRIGNNEVPRNCTSGKKWMIIDKNHTSIIALALTTWTLKRGATVYTTSTTTGFCKVIQVDPYEN